MKIFFVALWLYPALLCAQWEITPVPFADPLQAVVLPVTLGPETNDSASVLLTIPAKALIERVYFVQDETITGVDSLRLTLREVQADLGTAEFFFDGESPARIWSFTPAVTTGTSPDQVSLIIHTYAEPVGSLRIFIFWRNLY
jgi:hypothetical protein